MARTLAAALILSVAGAPSALAQAATCAKVDFEAVVDQAAGALRELNLKNRPEFQERLRQLKDKRGWSHDQFLKEAAPFVRDEETAVFDQKSEDLLAAISSMGQEGAEQKTPDSYMRTALKYRDQWQSRLLRTSSWSPWY